MKYCSWISAARKNWFTMWVWLKVMRRLGFASIIILSNGFRPKKKDAVIFSLSDRLKEAVVAMLSDNQLEFYEAGGQLFVPVPTDGRQVFISCQDVVLSLSHEQQMEKKMARALSFYQKAAALRV